MAAGKAETEYYQGMPQLDPEFMATQAFWFIVTIIVIYFILSRIAMPRIESIISERHGMISRDLDQAAELKRKAELAEDAYQTALAEARSESQRIAADAKAEIQKDLDIALAKADAEIAAQSAESEARIGEVRAGAVAAIEEVAKETGAEIVKALAPSVDAGGVADMVSSRLKG
ncbi:MAG: F0F1 ATP synthase subunit B' [Pseudomonadota bacterium]